MSTVAPTVQIRKLSALLVNQIAAGEVIERPASVLKELVENSIDAGATRITVELEQGGIELIRISDDGHGIAPDQMTLALAPHATSKIQESEDLDRIGTMGFRGEAIASIASISRMSIKSRTNDFDEGRIIEAEGDVINDPKPIGCPVGTTIEVRNLFFNTPARRKFLRATTTEQTRCVEWLRDLAMANPSIGVRCIGDGKVKLDLPINQTPRQRVVSILGKELEEQLIEVSVDQFDDSRGILIWGLVGLPAIARATSKAQHVFLNGRTIRDRTIQHAIREAYRGLIEPGKHPTAMVHRAVYHGVKDALGRADVTPTLLQRLPGAGFDGSSAIMPTVSPEQVSQQLDHQVEKLVEYFETKPRPTGDSTGGSSGFRQELKEVLAQSQAASPQMMGSASFSSFSPMTTPLPTVQRVDKVLQVHSSYLIAQDSQGVLIIDQHALHERVMFNKLLARVTGNGSLEQQSLLMPIVLDVPSVVVDKFDELDQLLERIGVQGAPMGPKSIGIHAVPSFLHSRKVEAEPFLAELFEKIDQGGFVPTSEEALHEVLDMMSCKAAIKAGDVLSDNELSAIMQLRSETERSTSCPHGRPTTVRLTIEELEKLFDRR